MNKNTSSTLGTLKQNGVHLYEHEYFTIKTLLEHSHSIELVHPSNIEGLHLPDIYIDGIPWEIKAPEGNGKNTIKHSIQKALLQSPNIILDLRRCKLKQSDAIKEAEKNFRLSKRVHRMKLIMFGNQYVSSGKPLYFNKAEGNDYIILDYRR